MFDVLGELVYRNPSPSGRLGGAVIDASGVAKGIYFVEIKTDLPASRKGTGVVRKKIIKE